MAIETNRNFRTLPNYLVCHFAMLLCTLNYKR